MGASILRKNAKFLNIWRPYGVPQFDAPLVQGATQNSNIRLSFVVELVNRFPKWHVMSPQYQTNKVVWVLIGTWAVPGP